MIAAFLALTAGPELIIRTPYGFPGRSPLTGVVEPMRGVASRRESNSLHWTIWPNERTIGPLPTSGGLRYTFDLRGPRTYERLKMRFEFAYQYSEGAEGRFSMAGPSISALPRVPNGFSQEIFLSVHSVNLIKVPAGQAWQAGDVDGTPRRWVWDSPRISGLELERGNLTFILRVFEFEAE